MPICKAKAETEVESGHMDIAGGRGVGGGLEEVIHIRFCVQSSWRGAAGQQGAPLGAP